eukprot:352989-Chlamydomonas_euryale.AAC.5
MAIIMGLTDTATAGSTGCRDAVSGSLMVWPAGAAGAVGKRGGEGATTATGVSGSAGRKGPAAVGILATTGARGLDALAVDAAGTLGGR